LQQQQQQQQKSEDEGLGQLFLWQIILLQISP